MRLAAEIIAWVVFGSYASSTLITPFLIGKKRDDWGPTNVLSFLLAACAMFVVALEVSQ